MAQPYGFCGDTPLSPFFVEGNLTPCFLYLFTAALQAVYIVTFGTAQAARVRASGAQGRRRLGETLTARRQTSVLGRRGYHGRSCTCSTSRRKRRRSADGRFSLPRMSSRGRWSRSR